MLAERRTGHFVTGFFFHGLIIEEWLKSLRAYAMDTNQELQLLTEYDWKRPVEGNPEEYQVIRVTKDLQVFRNGELEGKIRMFRNGKFSFFGYTLQSVDEEAKVVWNPLPSKKKKDAPAIAPAFVKTFPTGYLNWIIKVL